LKKVTQLHGDGSAKAVRRKTVQAKDGVIAKLRGDRERVYLVGSRVPGGLFARTNLTKPPAFAGLIYVKNPDTMRTVRKVEVTLGHSTRITAAEAVVRLNKLQAAADLGHDPKAKAKAQISDAKTAEELLGEYVKAAIIRTGQAKADTIKRLLDGYLDRPVTAITPEQVRAALQVLVQRGKLRSHNIALTAVRSWRIWVVKKYEYEIPDWTAGLENEQFITAQHRVLESDELKSIWDKAADLHPAYRTLVRTLLLTGLRLSEAAKMARDELESGDIVIPGSRMKNGSEHRVPISTALRAELDVWLAEASFDAGPYIFSTCDGRVPVSGWTNIKLKLGATDWSFHAFRHSMATGLAENFRIDDDLIERILSHKRSGVMGRYNRSVRIEERREALEKWGEWITS
jgi:integrase